MLLQNYIKQCGGIENICRVLNPEGYVIFEIKSPDRLDKELLVSNFSHKLQQLKFKLSERLDGQKLMNIGIKIAETQSEQAEAFSQPTACVHRPVWHVSPPSGLLNDPNGFIFHKGEYHLFYQWNPYGCSHKDKFWAHLVSQDLVTWQWKPVALTPSDWFDSHGVFSGHAISQDDELKLFYTGNVRIGEDRDRHTTQCLAVSRDGINFEKKGPVISELPPGVTPHCRDPKVIKMGDEWWMLLGAQKSDLKGCLAIYKSRDLENWRFDKLYSGNLGDFGYMWECPDLFELNDQLIAIIGPQGIEAESDYHTVPHHNGYLKAEIDSEGELAFSDFECLDVGFDFYAPQSLATPDGRRVIIAWMGLPDEVDHPSVDNGWIHQLTCPREITFVDGKVIQVPLKELESLRSDHQHFLLENSGVDLNTKSFELETELRWGSRLSLFKDDLNEVAIELGLNNTLYLNRVKTEIREGDTIRELKLAGDTVKLRILADNSSLEIFVNDGEHVLSCRAFTPPTATGMYLHGQGSFDTWFLTR